MKQLTFPDLELRRIRSKKPPSKINFNIIHPLAPVLYHNEPSASNYFHS